MPTKKADKQRIPVRFEYFNQLPQKLQKELDEISFEVRTIITNTGKKKIGSCDGEGFWSRVVKYLPKPLIQRIVAYNKIKPNSWQKHFINSCIERHEGGNHYRN